MALNTRQKKFIQEYKLSGNATDAVIRAGYSPNGASVVGTRLTRIPEIKKIIEESRQGDIKILSSPVMVPHTIKLPDKMEYALKAWERASDESPLKEDTKHKYYVTAGQVLKYVGREDISDAQQNTFQIICKELNLSLAQPVPSLSIDPATPQPSAHDIIDINPSDTSAQSATSS